MRLVKDHATWPVHQAIEGNNDAFDKGLHHVTIKGQTERSVKHGVCRYPKSRRGSGTAVWLEDEWKAVRRGEALYGL
jgi:hypothetical protein